MAGVPWWGALLIAVCATVIGYGIDAGHKELTHVFAACYIAGCVIAVLAVRQSGVFTAVIQPPLILFCAVPGAYWLFHGAKIDKLKDLLINCGYPLIERFPLMLGTAGVVLLIGLARWYFGMTHRPAAADTDGKAGTTTRTEPKSVLSGFAAKFASMLSSSDDDEDETSSTRPRTARRSSRTTQKPARAARGTRSAQRPDRTRSRHSRAGEEQHDPAVERRQRRRAQQRPRDFDAADPPRRSRRPRPQAEPDPLDRRSQPPREGRRDSYGRRGSYERPPSRRLDPYESYEPPPEQFSRYESYEQPRRRAAPGGSQGANPTHHPISQVRYRGSRDERPDDPRAERRGRPRAPRRHQAESWEYDF